MSVMSIFRLKFEKTNVIFETSTFEFIQILKIEQNNNNKKLGPKMHYLSFLDRKIGNAIAIFGISTLEFTEMPKNL